MTSIAANRIIADLSARGVDELAGWWEHQAPDWDELDRDARDLLSVLSSLLGAGVSSDTRIDV